MNASYDHIAIIFNPNSTGDAPQLAAKLATQIEENQSSIACMPTLTPTKRAGHAITLARSIALTYKRPLIVSVSGDGGYNEVINGVVRAKVKRPSVAPIVAVLGAGNANDHQRVMRDQPLLSLIQRAQPKPLDILALRVSAGDFKLERYAHSYIGLGITPQVGYQLNRHQVTFFVEMKLIISTLFTLKPFIVEYDGISLMLDNLVFANINEMAKVVQLDNTNTVRDGKFEVIQMIHRNKAMMLLQLLKAALFGFKHSPQYSLYQFVLAKENLIQLDGEIEKLPPASQVEVASLRHAVESLY